VEGCGYALAPSLVQWVGGIAGGKAHGDKSAIFGDRYFGSFIFQNDVIFSVLPAITLRKGGVAVGQEALDVFDKVIPGSFVGFFFGDHFGDNIVEVNSFDCMAMCGYGSSHRFF
jgi:hypothetical protein